MSSDKQQVEHICGSCGSKIDRALDPPHLEFDDDGIPYAASVKSGLGIAIDRPGQNFIIKRNGIKVEHCVAYDRRAGCVWVFQSANGKILSMQIEKYFGDVTVERRE